MSYGRCDSDETKFQKIINAGNSHIFCVVGGHLRKKHFNIALTSSCISYTYVKLPTAFSVYGTGSVDHIQGLEAR